MSAARAFRTPRADRPAGLAFRDVAPSDHGFLVALYAATRAAELAPVPWPDDAKHAFLAEQFVLQDQHYRAHYPGADLLVVLRDGAPIGRVYVYRGVGDIRLMDIILIEPERGRGYGVAMLRELMDEARATMSTVTLHVEPQNPAQQLYASLGFRLIEDRGVYHFLAWAPPGVALPDA